MKLINPATEEVTEIEETPLTEISSLVEKARNAQTEWGEKSPEERARIVSQIVGRLEERIGEYAPASTADMGKPDFFAAREITMIADKIANVCKSAPKWLAATEEDGAWVEYNPLGVIGVISPWNFPYFCSFDSIIPALLAGNAVVYKPSEYAIRAGIKISELFIDLPDFPEDLFQIVIGSKDHGKELVKQDIQMISFIGSTAAGKDIMKNSSADLKKLLLELGGMDAAIVLKDCDIKETAKNLVQTNCYNSGQVCCSVKRVYIEQDIFDQLRDEMIEVSKGIVCGDPADKVTMGPLSSREQYEKVSSIVEDAKSKGATVHTGGAGLRDKGFFYPSTIVSGVTKDMRILTEEPFGPVLPLIPFDTINEAITESNNSPYGLTGSVWTSNEAVAKEIASKLEVGVVGINKHGSGPTHMPWGGAKQSGVGRANSAIGIRNYTNIKTVHIAQ